MSPAIEALNSAQFAPHPLHHNDRLWTESNCYVDLWVEVLHALRLDPIPGLAFTLAMDFEGDQWTFFKYPLGDLLLLYGIDVQELNIWRGLVEHVEAQVARGRLVVAEANTFFLPNMEGYGYHASHHKSTIGIESIDVGARRLGYFHHRGYYTVSGDDFDGLFRLGEHANDGLPIPLYIEIAKLDALKRRAEPELIELALELAWAHIERAPQANPFVRYQQQFADDLQWLRERGRETFHEYAYATMRQCGANYEYAAVFLRWLAARGRPELETAAAQFEEIAGASRALMLKTARAIMGGKTFDATPILTTMAANWDAAMTELARLNDE